MATFHEATDASGRPVIRCFVKGAAPAVMDRSATALSGGTTIAWDADLARRAQNNVERMAGLGQRVMAAAMRDIDPDAFDPDGDLLAHMTRPADDQPGRDGRSAPSRVQGGRRRGPGRPHPGAHDHRRRRHDGCGHRRAARHPRRGHARRRLRRPVRSRAPGPHRRHRGRGTGRSRAQGPPRRHPQEEGRGRGHDGRRRERRAGHQGRRHRHRHGLGHRGGQERRTDDPLRRQLRHHRLRGRAGSQDLRQPHQVHPLRPRPPRRLRPHLPRRVALQHRRRRALHARHRSCGSTSS